MRKLAVSLMMLLFALATVAIHAGVAGTIEVNLPFAFTVNNKNFPAGNYKFEQPTGARNMAIRSVDGKVGEIFDTNPMKAKSLDSNASYLVFHRYGEKYFLQLMYIGRLGYEFPPSHAEKEMQQKGTEPVEVNVKIRESR
jgi:hypothetical protein